MLSFCSVAVICVNFSKQKTNKKKVCLYCCKEVHKKICIPLPGLFQKGRLYKAQSCGSLVRDKVNTTTTTTPSAMTTSTTAVSTTANNSYLPPPKQSSSNTRHSAVLFTEKGKILRNCLVGAKFLGNNDGDINQNQSNHHHLMMMKTTTTATTTTKTMMMKNSSSSSLNHLKRNSISDGGYGNCDGAAAVVAAASLFQQFCSSQPSPLSATMPITTQIKTPLSVSTGQLSGVENYGKNDDNDDDNDEDDDDDDDENMSTSLHQLNDVPLCSSKC